MPFFGGGGGDYHIVATNIKGGTQAAPAVIGDNNMALGNGALESALNADRNIAVGNEAAQSLITGYDNVFIGYRAAYGVNETTQSSVFIGKEAGFSSIGDFSNFSVCVGVWAGFEAALIDTVAVGALAMLSCDGNQCVALGSGAGTGGQLAKATSVMVGSTAGQKSGAGQYTMQQAILIGQAAGLNDKSGPNVSINGATVVGQNALRKTGAVGDFIATDTIAIGRSAATTSASGAALDISNSIYIGTDLVPTAQNQIIIGDASHTSIIIGGIDFSAISSGDFTSAIIGDPGTEGTGINIGGVTYDALFKVSDISSADIAQSIIHRHSTTWEPIQVFARSNSNGAGHGAVVNGMPISSQYSAGWTGTEYNLFGRAGFEAAATGIISDASSPGDYVISTTPNGGALPVEAVRIKSDKSAVFAGGVVYAASTFASLPAPASVTGQIFFVSDVGKNGSLWRSNGTKWVLVQGETVLAEGATPVCLSPTGTIAANGALTLGFALPTIYSGGIWMYFPAGAVFAGSAAGFYWTVMSSTTLGTIYNDTRDPSAVNLFEIIGNTTAIVAAGPGAYTGVSSQTIVGSIQVLGNIMGLDGALEGELTWSFTSSASSKTGTTYFGAGSTINNFAATTTTNITGKILTRNRGVSNRQINNGSLGLQTPITGGLTYSSEDTTINNNILIAPQKTAANDCLILEAVIIKLINR